MFKRGSEFIPKIFSLNVILDIKFRKDNLSLWTCVFTNKVISTHLMILLEYFIYLLKPYFTLLLEEYKVYSGCK